MSTPNALCRPKEDIGFYGEDGATRKFLLLDVIEPPHIHIRRGDDTCKFWLRPVRLAYNDGMSSPALNELSKRVRERRAELERKWFEYFA